MTLTFSETSSIVLLLKIAKLEVHRDFKVPDLTVVVRTPEDRQVEYTNFVPTAFGSLRDAIGVSGECAEVADEVSFQWRLDGDTGSEGCLLHIEMHTEAGEVDDDGEVIPGSRLDRIRNQEIGRWREVPEEAFTYSVEFDD